MVPLLLSASLMLFPASGAAAEKLFPANPIGWPAISRDCRPWTYNWWLGSAVDTNNLARELRRYHEAGLGGIHIIPIYRAKGAKGRSIDFLSPRWMEMLRFSVEEGRRLDLGVDMTTGTGWCFGGPNISERQGGWRLTSRVVELPPGAEFPEKLDRSTVVALLAETDAQKGIDLRDRITPEGKLSWSPGKISARVFIVTATPAGPEVKRAAPGGAGLMLNPFDPEAMTHYLERFTAAFEAYRGPLPRAMYHDSYEYNSSWSPGLPDAFAHLRGYRIEDQWPAFCADPRTNQTAARVRADFKETLSDLMVEKVFPEWTQWSHSHGMINRYQAHGSPANLLDLYALADIPETEMFGRGARDPLASGFDPSFGEGDRDPLVSKFASSAAHLAGHQRVASETGTWMVEHFCETLEEMKCLADLLFTAGVNHVFYHGTSYSPDDLPWPGWLFYAATEMNPRNAIWRDLPALNTYLARCQSILQSGRSDNDILLYWPIHDFWDSEPALVSGLSVHNRSWLDGQPIGACARLLWERGYSFDYVSDRLLGRATASRDRGVTISGNEYRSIVVPPTRLMPLATLQTILDLAQAGAAVIFEKHLPRDVPGQGDLPARRAAFKELLRPLTSATLSSGPVVFGKGRVFIGELEDGLCQTGVPREPIADHPGARFIRRAYDGGRHYFIANQGATAMEGWFALATPAQSVLALDPMSGRSGILPARVGAGARFTVPLKLEPGQSVILRTFERRKLTGPAWRWQAPGEQAFELPGPWSVRFVAGGPSLPKPFEMKSLQSWTLNGDEETEAFAGTAVYRTVFDAPPRMGSGLLELGKVSQSARVRLNGKDLGTVFMKPFRLPIARLKARNNVLEIEVTNLSANRVRDLSRRKVEWQNFYLVNLHYKPFDASNWPIFDSGLLGPVRLMSVATELE